VVDRESAVAASEYARLIMTVALSVLLLLNGVFNIAVWPTFFRRVARDPRARDAAGKTTPFFIVHLVIVTVALVLAVVSLVAGALALLGVW
jgi:uncharacterized membrane protein YphA (DoxX/SURF4 family)